VARTRKKKGRRRRSGSGPDRSRATRLTLVVARVWAGAFFIAAVHHKLLFEGYTLAENYEHFRTVDYPDIVQRGIDSPPAVFGWRLDAFADLLEHVALPAADVLAPLVLAGEAWIGLCLVFGAFTRLAAVLGVVLMLAFNLARSLPVVTVKSANWPVTILLVLFGVLAAGRTLGLDQWLRPRVPGWLRWTT
jgi:uncharacterized membrane protein YphA (DoxX/SURF4 family)